MNNNYPINLALDYLLRDLRISFKESDQELVKWVREIYLTGEWDNRIRYCYFANRYGNQRNGITRSSIKMVKLLEVECGLELFPFIERTYAGHQMLSGGTWSWLIYGKDSDHTNYGTSDPTKEFFKKKNKIYYGDGFGYNCCELIAEKPFIKK